MMNFFKWVIRGFCELLRVMVIASMVTSRSTWCVAMAARTDPAELQAVYAMMAATGNTWASSIPDVCQRSGRWHGIECTQDGDAFHVTGLSFGTVTDHTTAFPACASDSTISPAVANLTHLRKLSYFSCCTSNPHPIPKEIGLLGSTLETLRLRNNGHIGPLPPQLAKLTKLRTLDIHGNSLTSTIPVWLSSLTSLELLDMSHNAFHGPLVDAAAFSNLDRLVILDASVNRLTGALPDSVGELKGLKKLDFTSNNFTGAIPATVGGLSNLLSLNLAKNSLTSPLPESLSRLTNLKTLDLGENRFRETVIPTWLGNLGSLEGLVLSKAEFCGPIPTSLGDLRSLKALYLDRNKLSGAIPPNLGALDHVYEMDLSGNFLTGPVPFSLRFVSRLGRRLRLQDNDGLCYDIDQFDQDNIAQGSMSTMIPVPDHHAPLLLPLLKICKLNSSNGDQISASVGTSSPDSSQRGDRSPVSSVPSSSGSSWIHPVALQSSDSFCLKATAFQTASKLIWFFAVFLVTV